MTGPLTSLFHYVAAAAETAPPTPDSPMTQIIIAALSAGGLGAIVAAIVAGLFSKKKLGAEATEIITKAAAGVVTNLQAEIDRQVALRQKQALEHQVAMDLVVAQNEDKMREVHRVLQLHVAWDAIAIAEMAKIGVNLPPAPPVFPPGLFEHHEHAPTN